MSLCPPTESSRLGFRGVLFGVLRPGLCNDPPSEDHDQRTEKSSDEILECYLQFPESEVDSEQPEKFTADHGAYHADEEVQVGVRGLSG